MRAGSALLALLWLGGAGLAAKESPAKEPGKGSDRKAEAAPAALTAEAINGASLDPDGKPKPEAAASRKRGGKQAEARPDPLRIKVQVLLDRARFSPGAIDGHDGDNLKGALAAFSAARGLPPGKGLSPELVRALQEADAAPVVTDYTITEADAAGPYVEKISAKMEEQADLESLGYTNAREMLAERFHMSRDLLSALNPDKPLDKAGTVILVAAVTPMGTDKPTAKDLPREPKVQRIEVDKGSRDLRAFDRDGKLVAYYPASIGSGEKPAPSGDTKVTSVAFEPTYTYNPKYAFKGVKSREKFSIKGGPNNPVGLVWIDLAIPSYGIHGTPEPEKVGKTESHGCIRLTNWAVRELAMHVSRGAKVTFKDE
ncbi:hypothetical protein MPOCJGCO_4206 [Methylobacterium trifolii]|uniref:L,D-TPase catalytic domain-containing protein n=2 Tax=Methylobacterium trifolii TaxID=1003092 RepID=A0ABQ4U6P6_9HYPH|nr:hypothetical protein MPOCJGCO_4206 [Methylobacterium trifolii]